jgi:hypothetical protein
MPSFEHTGARQTGKEGCSSIPARSRGGIRTRELQLMRLARYLTSPPCYVGLPTDCATLGVAMATNQTVIDSPAGSQGFEPRTFRFGGGCAPVAPEAYVPHTMLTVSLPRRTLGCQPATGVLRFLSVCATPRARHLKHNPARLSRKGLLHQDHSTRYARQPVGDLVARMDLRDLVAGHRT